MAYAPTPLRSIAAAAIAAAWLAVVVGSGGCEVAIGSAIPAFACDPGGDTCPSGQLCNPSTHQCVAGGCMLSGCQTGTCDPKSNVCVTADSGIVEASPGDTSVPESAADTMQQADTFVLVDTGTAETTGPCRSLGCPCSGAAACDSQICSDSLTVTSGLYAVAGNFCTKPCCTSSDCDANTVCFATGQGGDYCVEPAWLMRGTGIGAALGGAPCATSRDCRSALCDTAGGKCVDTCCSSGSTTQCAGGEACQFGKFAGAVTLDQNYAAFCAQGGGSGQDGSSCSSNSSCVAKLCAFDGAGNICHGVCRGAGDCASGESCQYVLPTATGTPPPVVAACFSSMGTLTEGTACNPTNDMCSGFCDPTAMVCTDVCFADSDCKSGWRCRPEMVSPQGGGSYSVLACGT